MTLYEKLQQARSEEDVKDAYIKVLEASNKTGDYAPVLLYEFKQAYTILSNKLRPQVYELGFLKSS